MNEHSSTSASAATAALSESDSAATALPRNATLCDALDRVLNTGVVAAGTVVLRVADIDLVYLDLRVMLTSVETARQHNMLDRAALRAPSS